MKSQSLAENIATRIVPENHLAMYWLSQAGFAFKTSKGKIVLIDPYLSDVVERLIGFKRMMTCPISSTRLPLIWLSARMSTWITWTRTRSRFWQRVSASISPAPSNV